jgi:L-seryl-tRNA(Ser) seleniumtransferase
MHPPDVNAALRRLPKVDEVLDSPSLRGLLARAPRWAVVAAVRGEIDRLRARLLSETEPGSPPVVAAPTVDAAAVEARVADLCRPSLRPVLNATGVVLHTNLGRAPLAASAIERVAAIARGYSNLEYRLDERRRGSRHDHVRALVAELCGAEDALVVNNCAAAVLLSLAALAAGREVVVSRGELVEIGGSFRVPDVMRASGARLVEVGTTNRTHRRDYQQAMGDATALLLKVHRSNFAVVGFVAEVEPNELAELAHARGLYAMVDLGSGALVDLRARGLGVPSPSVEPTVAELIASGVDLVTFSGDKLLGGPQAGLLVGRRAALEACRAHPLLRALRPDKLTLAALEATLELYRDGRSAELPSLAMLTTPEPELEARARRLHAASGASPGLEVVRVRSAVGGGALPLCEPWSWAVAITHPRLGADALDERLRQNDPPLVGRIADDRLLLDVRTLREAEIEATARAVSAVLKETSLA